MKLEELYPHISESSVVKITDYDTGRCISVYDGRNAIDPKYNRCKVAFFNVPDKNTLEIEIYLDQKEENL